jgi:class II lanthipeptide synthase
MLVSLRVKGQTERAKQRLQRWRSLPQFTTDSFFARRLAMNGLTEETLLYLLSESAETLRDRLPCPPAWLAELTQAFSQPTADDSFPLPESLRDQQAAGFLEAVRPLISRGRGRLREGIVALARTRLGLPFDPHTIEEILFANLPSS